MKGNLKKSVWTESVAREKFDPLVQSKETDILIIGGGMAGILCANMLKKEGVDCILVEADRICNGITKDTTAKITLTHGLLYDKLIKRFGQDKARLFLDAQLRACENYEKLCEDIDCDYEKKDSYVYSLKDFNKIKREVEALKLLGVKVELSDAPKLPFKVEGAVRLRDQAQFHPLKFAFNIAKTLPIYENTKVLELMPHKAVTQYGEIKCKKIIVATHFPILNKHGSYFLKMYQHRSYVLALKGAPSVDGMYVDEAETGLSFRNYNDLLLLGGGGHRTGKKGGCWGELEEFAEKHYEGARAVGRWATQDCMTLDGIAYIGQYSKHTPDLYVATGFNKWGMSSSMVAAMILSDLVCEKKNRYVEVFSPSRSIFRPQLLINGFETAVGFITPTSPRCPHLGCALKYNKAEHTWDCPCHGSRFTKHGKLIDNPATDNHKSIK